MSKPDVVAAVLSSQRADTAAAPFYRALEAVGARAADEAFVALRLVLAGRVADDAAVRRLRALARIVRAAALDDPAGATAAFERDRGVLGDVTGAGGVAALAAACRAAYFGELSG